MQIPDLLSAHVASAALVKVGWFSKHFLSLCIFAITFFKCKSWKSKSIKRLNSNKNISVRCSRDDIYAAIHKRRIKWKKEERNSSWERYFVFLAVFKAATSFSSFLFQAKKPFFFFFNCNEFNKLYYPEFLVTVFFSTTTVKKYL